MTGEPTYTVSEMVPCTPIIVWKVKNPLCFVVSFVQPVMQHFESRTIRKAPLQSSIPKEIVPRAPVIVWKSVVSITLHCWLCSTRYTAERIKNCLKSTSAIKIATMTNTDNFRYEGKPSRAIAKSTLFAVSKDEWNTKEETGKSMKNALYVLQYAKRHLSGWSNVEQWKNQAHSLSRYQVMLVWRNQSVSYSVSQSVTRKLLNKVFLKFRSNLLKECFGLIWKLVWA